LNVFKGATVTRCASDCEGVGEGVSVAMPHDKKKRAL